MNKCFACDRKVGKNPQVAITSDVAQIVYVGTECFKLIGPEGYQPPDGGPRLYRGVFNPDGTVREVVGLPGVRIPGYLKR